MFRYFPELFFRLGRVFQDVLHAFLHNADGQGVIFRPVHSGDVHADEFPLEIEQRATHQRVPGRGVMLEDHREIIPAFAEPAADQVIGILRSVSSQGLASGTQRDGVG